MTTLSLVILSLAQDENGRLVLSYADCWRACMVAEVTTREVIARCREFGVFITEAS